MVDYATMLAFAVFLIYIFAIFGAALLIRPVWRQWHLPMAIPLALFILFEFLICILYVILMSQSFPDAAETCTLIGRRLLVFMPTLWFWLTYEYIRRTRLKPVYVALLLVVPLYILLIYWRQWQPLIEGRIGPVPLAAVYATLTYGFVIGSIFWLAWHIYRTTGRVWRMLATLLLLSLFPLLTILYNAQILPYRLGAPMLLLILVPAVMHFRWLAIVPLARDQLADHLSDGVMVLDVQDRVVDANPVATSLLAAAMPVPVRLSYPLPLPARIREVFEWGEARKQQQEIAFTGVLHPMQHADALLAPLLDQQQRPIGRLLILHDISGRKYAEQEREQNLNALQAAHEQLQQLDELKTTFFANISHEFRTPLTLSLGPLDDLLAGLHGALPEAAQQPLRQIRRHNRRLLHLINQLLELSRLEAGGSPMATQPLNLVEYLPRVLAVFQAAAVRGGVVLRWTPLVAAAWVHSEYDALDKILANLLSNALKYTPAGGRIEVKLEAAGDHWQIQVRDTGCGIDPAFLPHVFERFSQQRPNEVQVAGALPMSSVGIGLALVKQLVTHHGGQISVSSVLGQGSCFTVLLPAAPVPETPVASLPAEPLAPLTSCWNDMDSMDSPPTLNGFAPPVDPLETDRQPLVLLVDDHPELRDYVAFHLTDRYQILTASNGLEGLQLAERHSPDLVISDVMMPVMDGYQLCQRLKSQRATSHIPVILLTARAGETDKLAGLEAQADDYLSKPFNRRELQARVANLLVQRIQLREYYSRLFNAPTDAAPVLSESAAEMDFLQQARQIIQQSLQPDALLVNELADALQLSERQLQRKVKALLGCSPQQLILEQRLHHASELLRQTAMTINEISARLGFKSPAHFTQKFKAAFQQTPSDYRRPALPV